MEWYPLGKKELNEMLERFLSQRISAKGEIHGLIVPHAGYDYSGEIAGKAFSLIKNKDFKKAIVLGPSHYECFSGVRTMNKLKSLFSNINLIKNDFAGLDTEEHSLNNQVPFLQKLGINEILPLIIGQISERESKKIAEHLIKDFSDSIYIFSTDLSHFLSYNEALKKDKETISAIENLNMGKLLTIENSACGIFPLMIMIQLCRIKSWIPKLIEYKNSGDIAGDKNSVVGYAGFWF